MKVYEYILESVEKRGTIHMTLIDPDPAKVNPERAGAIAEAAERGGSAAIMLGGSTGVTREVLDAAVEEIRGRCSLPVILFPGGLSGISLKADAIYFMSMLNSRNPEMISWIQARAARALKFSPLETIPMGYIIVEPGMTVGRVGQAEVVKRDDVDTAVGFALAAELFGMKLVYLEAGSGAPEHVPPEMVREVAGNLDIPLVVGGGIRTPEAAGTLAKAGASIIVTGTLVERVEDVEGAVRAIVRAVSRV